MTSVHFLRCGFGVKSRVGKVWKMCRKIQKYNEYDCFHNKAWYVNLYIIDQEFPFYNYFLKFTCFPNPFFLAIATIHWYFIEKARTNYKIWKLLAAIFSNFILNKSFTADFQKKLFNFANWFCFSLHRSASGRRMVAKLRVRVLFRV